MLLDSKQFLVEDSLVCGLPTDTQVNNLLPGFYRNSKFRLTSAMAHVNSMISKIHDVIQTSGRHFLINQTPWSSYITIRKKFVDPNHVASLDQNDRQSSRPSSDSSVEPFNKLVEEIRQLKLKNEVLENSLIDLEEETKDSDVRSQEKVQNLHALIDKLEDEKDALQSETKDAEVEILALKKEIDVKDEIICNINNGLNKKVKDLKVKVETLEGALKKEKKMVKKVRQKANKDKRQEELEIEELENNNKTESVDDSLDCELCNYKTGLNCEMQKHVELEHHEEVKKIQKIFHENNSESLNLLENVPESEFILTPEEITHFGVDWKTHLKIMEILQQKKPS